MSRSVLSRDATINGQKEAAIVIRISRIVAALLHIGVPGAVQIKAGARHLAAPHQARVGARHPAIHHQKRVEHRHPAVHREETLIIHMTMDTIRYMKMMTMTWTGIMKMTIMRMA